MVSDLKPKVPSLFTRVFKPGSIVSIEEAEALAGKAATESAAEEKRWNEGGVKRGGSFLTDPQDYSYLYEAENPPVAEKFEISIGGKKRTIGEKVKKVIEHFVGTYISGSYFTEQDGQALEELQTMQAAALHKYFTDPLCTSIIDNWTSYTIGGGIKVHVDNPKVMEVIKTFRNKNKMIRREKQLVKMFNIEGELFIAYFIDKKTGNVSLRRIRPLEVQEIRTNDEDIETKEAYHWEYSYTPPGSDQAREVSKWVPDLAKYMQDVEPVKSPAKVVKTKRQKKAKNPSIKTGGPWIQHVKTGIDVELRGRVPLQSVMRHLKFFEDWLMDRIRLNHERAKVVWIKEIKGGRTTEDTTRQRRSPRGGIMLIETENVSYRIEAPKLASDDAKEDGLAILYNIAAGTKLPIHILVQRADQEVYASIKKSDSPFSQFIRSQQEFFAEVFEEMYRVVIKAAIEAGTLKGTVKIPTYSMKNIKAIKTMVNEAILEGVSKDEIWKQIKAKLDSSVTMKKVNTEDIPISIEFPAILTEDEKDQAEVMKLQDEMGIVSKATLSAKAGYNWEKELDRMAQEKVLDPDGDDESDGDDSDNGEEDEDT